MNTFPFTPASTSRSPTSGSSAGDDVGDEVIDLVPYIRPVRRLVAWYNQIVDPDPAVGAPNIYELDEIVTSLKSLDPLPGQLGRDLATVTTASEDALAEEIIWAILRLGHLAALDDDTAAQRLTDDDLN